jgi:hypothetical protein
MKERKFDEENVVFIAETTGTTTKLTKIPKEVCQFCDIEKGDLVQFKILCVKKQK